MSFAMDSLVVLQEFEQKKKKTITSPGVCPGGTRSNSEEMKIKHSNQSESVTNAISYN